jgi:TonB family protein
LQKPPDDYGIVIRNRARVLVSGSFRTRGWISVDPALEGADIMRLVARCGAIALGLAIAVAGCASPPTADVDAAKAALDKATTDRADHYAADSIKAEKDSRAALEAELTAQEAKMVNSYVKAKELAVAAKTADDRASAEAVAAKATADAAPRAKMRPAAVRPGGRLMPPQTIKDVPPGYPALARSAGVSGAVTIEATIGPDGKVADTKVVHSIPLLDQAALDAVRQWEYLPSMLNGVPVPVLVTVTINFAK